MSAFLDVRGLSKRYRLGGFPRSRWLDAVRDVSFTVARGEVLGLVGASGSGKSTAAAMITRQIAPSAGSIRIDGEDWLAHRGEALRQKRRDVQLVFQDPLAALDPRMTLGTSMGAPLAFHGVRDAAERQRRVARMLSDVGLAPDIAGRLPRACSGGQLQRVVVGRALLLNPKLLVCDEPTSALDASIKAQIMNLFFDLKTRRGLTMVMISHDLRAVRLICDRIAVMHQGRIVETAPTEVLFERPGHAYTQALLEAAHIGLAPDAAWHADAS